MASRVTRDDHVHFSYDLRLDNIEREETQMRKCSNKSNERVHCAYLEKFTGIKKKASEKRTEKMSVEVPFSIILPVNSLDLQKYRDRVFQRTMIERVFSTSVISEADISEVMDELTKSMTKLLLTLVTNPAEVQIAIEMEKQKVISKRFSVEDEVPHTKWLYSYLSTALNKGFVVKSRKENLKYVGDENFGGEITDYASSSPDIIIHSNKPLGSHPSVCLVKLIPELDNASAFVAEIKESDETEYPISECFRNMSTVAANLTIQGLQQGLLVNQVSVYGIVAVVCDVERARLLKLVLDFTTNTSKFMKNFGVYAFDLLLNAIIDNL